MSSKLEKFADNDVLGTSRTKTLYLLLHGGDQLYADEMPPVLDLDS